MPPLKVAGYGVLGLLLVCGALTACSSGGKSSHPSTPTPLASAASVQTLLPHGPAADTLYDKARRVRHAIHAGDFSAADKITGKVLADSRVGRWHFAPFSTFIAKVTAPSDATFARELDAWVKAEPNASLPRLVRANYHWNHAWWVRGHGYTRGVSAVHMTQFGREIKQAAEDTAAVLKRDADNPNAWFLQVLMVRNVPNKAMRKAVFTAAIAHLPHYSALYATRLHALQPKWGGSVAGMNQFVAKYAGSVLDAPRRMLYLRLYVDLLDIAAEHCGYSDARDAQQCVAKTVSALAGPDVTQAAQQALALAKPGDTAATREVYGQVWAMVDMSGAEIVAARFLGELADVRHADMTLHPEPDAHTDWVVDDLAGLVWFRRGNDDNALRLYRRAIKDLHQAHMPHRSDADEVRAQLYHAIENVYHEQGAYRQAVRYGVAAAQLLGGYGAVPSYSHMTCSALFRLKRYTQAVHVCSAIVDASGQWRSRFFRARTYQALHQRALAIAEYRVTAGAQTDIYYRTYSAIEIAVMHDQKGEVKQALDALDEFRGLFVPGQANDDSMASYYNDRCYSEMKLGRTQAALNDCDTSLRYGNLPDALAKKHKLKRQLQKAGSTATKA